MSDDPDGDFATKIHRMWRGNADFREDWRDYLRANRAATEAYHRAREIDMFKDEVRVGERPVRRRRRAG